MEIEKIPLLFFFIIGNITIYHALEQRDFVKNAEYTTGMVIDIAVVDGARGKSYFPIVEFIMLDNKSYQFKTNIVNPGYQVGDQVGVRYLKGDLYSAAIWHHAAVWNRVYFLSFLTVISLFIGLGLSVRRK